MAEPKALFFDVGGTIFDWNRTAIDVVEAHIPGRADPKALEAFTIAWRKTFFQERERVAHGYAPWMNADRMQLNALKKLTSDFPFLNSISDHETFVLDVWHNLKPFDGAAEALARLRACYPVIVLTILSWASIVKSSKRHDLVWDGILSCEFLGAYKPSFQAYRKACQLMQVQSGEAMMVAAHEQDLAAAKTTGMQTAYVGINPSDKIFEAAYPAENAFDHDMTAESFADLCGMLGC